MADNVLKTTTKRGRSNDTTLSNYGHGIERPIKLIKRKLEEEDDEEEEEDEDDNHDDNNNNNSDESEDGLVEEEELDEEDEDDEHNNHNLPSTPAIPSDLTSQLMAINSTLLLNKNLLLSNMAQTLMMQSSLLVKMN